MDDGQEKMQRLSDELAERLCRELRLLLPGGAPPAKQDALAHCSNCNQPFGPPPLTSGDDAIAVGCPSCSKVRYTGSRWAEHYEQVDEPQSGQLSGCAVSLPSELARRAGREDEAERVSGTKPAVAPAVVLSLSEDLKPLGRAVAGKLVDATERALKLQTSRPEGPLLLVDLSEWLGLPTQFLARVYWKQESADAVWCVDAEHLASG